MKRYSMLTRLASATIATIALFGLRIPSASAAPDIPPGLSPDQQAAVKALNTSATVSSKATVTKVSAAASNIAPMSVYSNRAVLYRGSALMWARDTMTWYYTGSSMSSSYLGQEAGYIFPNVSQAKGTSEYYSSSWEHAWSGRYTIGAGVVTPWGAVTVYAQDYSTSWQVYGNGAWSGRWN